MSTAELQLNPSLDPLQELVQRHKICWESYPVWHIRPNGEKIQIGFELDLIGTHDHPQKPPSAGCDECHKVYRALLTIAQAILPPRDRASRSTIDPYDVSISFSPRRRMRKDVRLAIDIAHRNDFDQPVDACEVRCLCEMKQKLKELGVRPEHW